MNNYTQLNTALEQAGILVTAAETQGILCGLLCSPRPLTEDIWLKYLFGEMPIERMEENCKNQLISLKIDTLSQLDSMEFEFTPLLPEDDCSLATRAQALGAWCAGFLFGLGLTGVKTHQLLNYVKEFLADMTLITRVALTEQENDGDEQGYYQLVEYIKVGVLTVYEELKFSNL